MSAVKRALQQLRNQYGNNGSVPVGEIEKCITENRFSQYDAEMLISGMEKESLHADSDPYVLLTSLFGEAQTEAEKDAAIRIVFTSETIQDTIRSIRSIPRLSEEEEQKLMVRIRQGDANARNRFYEANLYLAINVAMSIAFVRNHPAFEDILQEGFIGISKAIERFDADKKCRFSTYAVWWIRSAVYNALTECSMSLIRSSSEKEKLQKLKKAKQTLEQQLQREPSYEEIAKIAGMKTADVAQLLIADQHLTYLDDDLDDEDDSATLMDFVPDETIKYAEETYADTRMLEAAVESLLPYEKDVLTLRIGLFDHKTHTLKETAEALNMTMPDVRQIETMAIRKLKNNHDIEADLK